LRIVGSALQKQAYKHHEIQLAEPLLDNQSIELRYRENLNANWTSIGTMSVAGKTSDIFYKTVEDLERYQLSAVIDTAGKTTPSVLFIRSF